MAKKKTTAKKKPKTIPVQEPVLDPEIKALASRIPFQMLRHISGDKWHSARFTNEKLGIGHEYHHPAKNWYVKTGPNVKVKRWFYRESPADAPCYPTLYGLLETDKELMESAKSAYPARPKCPNCGVNAADAPHVCPYQQEINDSEEQCCCCVSCAQECAMDI